MPATSPSDRPGGVGGPHVPRPVARPGVAGRSGTSSGRRRSGCWTPCRAQGGGRHRHRGRAGGRGSLGLRPRRRRGPRAAEPRRPRDDRRALENDTTTLVLVWENLWATGFADAVRAARRQRAGPRPGATGRRRASPAGRRARGRPRRSAGHEAPVRPGPARSRTAGHDCPHRRRRRHGHGGRGSCRRRTAGGGAAAAPGGADPEQLQEMHLQARIDARSARRPGRPRRLPGSRTGARSVDDLHAQLTKLGELRTRPAC